MTMDPALLRQRREFMQNAIKSMGVQKNGEKQSSSQTAHGKKAKKRKTPATVADISNATTSATMGVQVQNAASNSILHKIVDYMKKRHLETQNWPLSLQECIDEMQMVDVQKRTFAWLQQAIKENPKLQIVEDGKFEYKPIYRVRNRKTLLDLLKRHYYDAKGGVTLSDLNESVHDAEQLIKGLGNHVIDIPTQASNKQKKDHVYFWNATSEAEDFPIIDEDFVKLWRSAGSVEHLDDKKVEEYLLKHGISTVKDLTPKKTVVALKRKERKRTNQKIHNVHLEGVLEDFTIE